MKIISPFILSVFFNTVYSQSSNSHLEVIHPSIIVKDMMSWLYYQRDHLVWSSDYISYNTSMMIIPRNEFLDSLCTGKYLPLLIEKGDSSKCYQLYSMDQLVDKDIVSTIINMAQVQLRYYKWEKLMLPDLNFIDLKGNVYNRETTKDKVIVLNCWFVHCKPCVAEIPSLNQLVKKYKNRKDILFLALTFDSAENIIHFLKQNPFNYAIVPDKEDYLTTKLNIVGYPTQIVVNRQGLIVKIIESNKINELIDILNKEINN